MQDLIYFKVAVVRINDFSCSRFHYEVLVTEGSWQGEENAKKFDVKGPPFILRDIQEGSFYTVAVKLVTDEGYHSMLSELNSVKPQSE
jgi:hypothetical protein